MTHKEIREKFKNFFERNGHKFVVSSSLIPDDPSVLLTTAGMQQFKPYYTGEADAMRDFGSLNTASIQKCFRTSDIDEVGDETHLTFFEMMGNFSFGGYFKREAITLACQFIQEEMGLEIRHVTVFKGSDSVPRDEASRAIWNELGVRDVREEGMSEVFWGPTGNAGPCGPTTEIYCRNASGQNVEVWNIVFNEYFCAGSREDLMAGRAELKPLSPKGIDTGMGFERLVMISQGVKNIFETDLFGPLMDKLTILDERKRRVIADHLRATVFLLADGVRPSNKDAGYILRRILRRALTYEYQHQMPAEALKDIILAVIAAYGEFYPELGRGQELILQEYFAERERFRTTLHSGLKMLDKITGAINGEAAFKLYESYGLPYEVIKEFGGAKADSLSREAFDIEFKKHQELSRSGAEKKFGGHGLLLDTGELKAATEEEVRKVIKLHTATHLLQAALRQVLGKEIHQMGSDITSERLRFDFNFPRKMTGEELRLTEEFVNSVISRDLSVTMKEEEFDAAIREGALAFFKGKYPARVKVYSIGDASKEVCGGPHVASTGEIGKFKILKEEAISSGVRRIRAVVS